VNWSGPDSRYRAYMTHSLTFDLFWNADYHGNCEIAYRATISVAGEAYRAAVWRLGAKSLFSGEFCGRGGGNEPRRLRQKLLPQSLLHVRIARVGTYRSELSERRRNESSFDFSGKILALRVFPLPAVTDSTFVLFAVISAFLSDCGLTGVFIILKHLD